MKKSILRLLAILVCGTGTLTAISEKKMNNAVINMSAEETSVSVSESTTTENFYDVPLDMDTQLYIRNLCKQHGVKESLVYAVISVESDFDKNSVNSNKTCWGLMQINSCNFEEYGITEPLDVKQNVNAGISILGKLLTKYNETEKALIAYNCGVTGANKLFDEGVCSTAYSRKVLTRESVIELEYN